MSQRKILHVFTDLMMSLTSNWTSRPLPQRTTTQAPPVTSLTHLPQQVHTPHRPLEV